MTMQVTDRKIRLKSDRIA